MGDNQIKEDTHLQEIRQTIKLGLYQVTKELFPEEELKTAYSIGDGIFCKLADSVLSEREVELIDIKLKEWMAMDRPIEFLHQKYGYYVYQLGDMIVKGVYPAETKASMGAPFRLIPFLTGFIIDFSEKKELEEPVIFPSKLAESYAETQRWLSNINMEFVSDVNAYIKTNKALELQNVAEALQEKQIADIADQILIQRRALRLILISGPSSSGKTTFAQRLSTQLRVNGFRPVPLSLDNYFVNREKTPRDAEGNYDYETIKALDLKLLQEQVKRIIDGEKVETPLFDFITGKRMEKTLPFHLDPSEILVIEGIHALNPKLLPNIAKSASFKVYVSALFGMNVDLINRVPTTEVRIIRRMVRDGRERGINPEQTLERWPSVRKGETEYVFKYQEEADAMFNSGLLYEMNALRPFAETLLNHIGEGSSHYNEKERLLNLLSFFEPMDASKVPFNSILREFIGGSSYK
ncbi:MAG: uridine kinase [Clostridiaceae bacterium]